MSDKADIVQHDELQSEFQSAESRQSPRDAAAAAAGLGPPERNIRSYDREMVCAPPSYSKDANAAALRHQQQLDQEQATGYRGYVRPCGRAASQQSVRVITLPADCQVVRIHQTSSGWTAGRTALAVIIAIKVVIIIIAVIVYASLASQ